MSVCAHQISDALPANLARARSRNRAMHHHATCGQHRSCLGPVSVLARAQPNGRPLRVVQAKSAAPDVHVTSAVASEAPKSLSQPISLRGEGLVDDGLPTSRLTHSSAIAPPFSWTSHWWPLHPESYLLPNRPNPVTLLGIPMVVWRDGSGCWRVFKDQCPHRLAPLSEGRVESDGTLSCSYHGWRFCGSGGCTRIPQAISPAAETAACSSRRAAATSYPAQVKAGMLWVWPEEGCAAAAAAATAAPLMTNDFHRRVAEVEASNRNQSKDPSSSIFWYMRDLPYSYEVLIENLTDPAHLPFSHHGLTPNLQRPKGGGMPMQPRTNPLSPSDPPPNWARPDQPDFEYEFVGNIARDGNLTVNMPYLLTYNYPGTQIELHAIPVGPGCSRFFSVNVVPPRPPPMPPLHTIPPLRLMALIAARLDPVVSMHMMTNKLLDGDSVFLAVQDQVLQGLEAKADAEWLARQDENGGEGDGDGNGANGGGSVWSRAYYAATPSDSVMLSVRKWLEERAGGGPFRARQRQLLVAAKKAGAAAGGLDRTAVNDKAIAAVAAMLLPQAERQRVSGQAPGPSERARFLDRYEQHTRHCPACRTRLQQLQSLGAAAQAVRTACLVLLGVAVGLTIALAAGAGGGSVNVVEGVGGWPLAVAAVASVGWLGATLMAGWAQRTAQGFMFVDYVHAEKD